MSHRHYCDYAGHDWQFAVDCKCICGLPMEGNDHSECPVELRACPEHSAEQERRIAEAICSEPDVEFTQMQQERPHCACGCAEAELSKVVRWCLHCGHVYVNYSPKIGDLHFADYYSGAPEELKKPARQMLAKSRVHVE
jgi:hypothetical protein